MLYWRIRIRVGEVWKCVTIPAACHVEPLVSSPLSTSTTSVHPFRARWYATLQPAMPPPTITTRACSFTRRAPPDLALSPCLSPLLEPAGEEQMEHARDDVRVEDHHRHGRGGRDLA